MGVYRGTDTIAAGIPIAGTADRVGIWDYAEHFTGDNVEAALEQLGDKVFTTLTSTDVAVVDSSGYFDSANVEGVLAEIGAELAALPATQVTITDSGGYYASSNVETALQEIGQLSSTKYAQLTAVYFLDDVTTGDGKSYLHIPTALNGVNLISVHAEVITAGTTGTTDIQIHNVTQAVDMLSTKLTIDSAETGSDTAATPAVIDTNNDDVAAHDLIRVDVDAVSSTAPKGLLITLGFGV